MKPEDAAIGIIAAALAAVAALLALAPPARADGGYSHAPRMTLEPGEGECFAIVQIEDRVGWYQETEILNTLHGPVSIKYTTHGGQAKLDEFQVLDLPPMVEADPEAGPLDPHRKTAVCLSLGVGM